MELCYFIIIITIIRLDIIKLVAHFHRDIICRLSQRKDYMLCKLLVTYSLPAMVCWCRKRDRQYHDS